MKNSEDFIDNNIIVNGRVGVILRKLEPLLKLCKHKQRSEDNHNRSRGNSGQQDELWLERKIYRFQLGNCTHMLNAASGQLVLHERG